VWSYLLEYNIVVDYIAKFLWLLRHLKMLTTLSPITVWKAGSHVQFTMGRIDGSILDHHYCTTG